MAALNKDETEDLRKIQALLDHVRKNGFTPDEQPSNQRLANQLELARRRLHTLVTMKGYYPK